MGGDAGVVVMFGVVMRDSHGIDSREDVRAKGSSLNANESWAVN